MKIARLFDRAVMKIRRSRRLHIVFLARRYPPSIGGMERFAYDLSTALEEKVSLKKITWGGKNKWLPLVLPWFFLRAFFYVIGHRDVDVIHIQDGVQAPVGWLLSRLTGRPYVVIAHGLDITYAPCFYQRLIIPFVLRADAILSISSATNDEVLKRGCNKNKANIVLLGAKDDFKGMARDRTALDTLTNHATKGKTVLLTTGRLVKRKGVEWFVDNVLPSLSEAFPELIYLVIGDGHERVAIEQAIARRDLSEVVVMLGRVSDSDRAKIYLGSDIFVMPNIQVSGDMEGFGIVAQEAAIAGLPLVASGIEGIKDAVVDGENGILVPAGSKDDYVAQLSGLLKDRKRIARLGARARTFTLQHFSWSRIADQYVAVYKNTVDRIWNDGEINETTTH